MQRRTVGPGAYAAWGVGAWAVLMLIAVVDGLVRIRLTVPAIGPYAAFAVSAVVMFGATALVAWRLAANVAAPDEMMPWVVGFLWVILTMAVEGAVVRLGQGGTLLAVLQDGGARGVLSTQFIIPGVIFMGIAPWLFDRLAAYRDERSGGPG